MHIGVLTSTMITWGCRRSTRMPASKAETARVTSNPSPPVSEFRSTPANSWSASTTRMLTDPGSRSDVGMPCAFMKAQQLLDGDAAILAAGNAIAVELAAVEPLRHGAGRHVADAGDLTRRQYAFSLEVDHSGFPPHRCPWIRRDSRLDAPIGGRVHPFEFRRARPRSALVRHGDGRAERVPAPPICLNLAGIRRAARSPPRCPPP